MSGIKFTVVGMLMLVMTGAHAERYAPEFRNAFLQSCEASCTQGTPSSEMAKKREYCQKSCACSLEGLENNFSESELTNNMTKMMNGQPAASGFEQKLNQILTTCAESVAREVYK